MSTEVIELTDANFKEQLAEETGILFYYKKICPHCKALRKVVEKFTAANAGVAAMQIDSEENPGAMETMGVEKVPTLLVIKNGEVAARKVGLMNVREMTALYKTALR
jgi:thioredoxin 1